MARNILKPLAARSLGVVAVLALALGPLSGCSRFTNISSVDAETIAVTGVAATLVDGAVQQVGQTTEYDPSYVAISYPNGDVPLKTGVCSDVVVRAYRHAGLDLQQLLHEDMARNFAAYPRRWELTKPDANIDHRRVPNLAAFFTRHGGALSDHPGCGRLPAGRRGHVVNRRFAPHRSCLQRTQEG